MEGNAPNKSTYVKKSIIIQNKNSIRWILTKIQFKILNINKIFLCISTYIWKLDIFSTYLNFNEKWFFGYFKREISKCSYITSILQPVLAQGMQHGPSNKQKKKISSKWSHCIHLYSFPWYQWNSFNCIIRLN